jgi:hypothetical protein
MFNLRTETRGLQNRRRWLAGLPGSPRARALGYIGRGSTLAVALTTSAWCLSCLTGCASSLTITERIAAPRAASYVDEKLHPSALLRGEQRSEIPEGAKLTAEAIVLSKDEAIVLQDHDSVVVDEQGALVGINGKSGNRTFTPGTARLAGDVVKVSDSAPRTWMTFEKNDVVELKGSYEAGDVTPTGGRIDGKRSVGLVVLGSLLFAAAYVPSAIIGANSDVKGDKLMLVPLLGPWLDLARRDKCNPGDSAEQTITPCQTESFNNALLITSGVTQLIGAGFFAAGLWTRATYSRELQPTSLRLVPHVGRTGGSVDVRGTF